MRRLLIALFPLGLVACGNVTPPDTTSSAHDVPLEQQIAEGREIASHQCANCHGLDKEDAKRADAPALRHLLADYDSEALKENFRDGIKVGHPDMPDFVFGPLGADVLLTYIESIQEPLDE